MHSFDVTAESPSAPEQIWRLLLDASSWPSWAPVDALERNLSTDLDPAGVDAVGATRAFRTGRVVTRERITELRAPSVFRYEGVENEALADYTASVELTPTAAGGTTIRWRGTYIARRRPHFVTVWYLRRFMQRMVDGLADD